MKAASFFLTLLLPVLATAQTPAPPPAPVTDLRQLLQDGLFEEEANRNLEKASTAYEALIEKFAQDRQFAATAVFRLAEIRVKQNRKEDAVALFQRVVTEFGSDRLAQLSRDRIAALGGAVPPPGAGGASDKEAEWITHLQDLVKGSPDLLNAPGVDKMVPLQRAAQEGWLKAAAFLLDQGADLGARFGTPALNQAAQAGRKAMVELLLARGADINLTDAQGRTPLLDAITEGRVEVARLLLEKGALPNARTGGNYSPLHAACDKGDLEFVRLLLDKGADVNVVSSDAPPAGARVVRDGNGRLLSQPVPRGGDGRDIGTPLMAAVRQRHLEVAKLLLERGAKPNVKVSFGSAAESRSVTALRLAVDASGGMPINPVQLPADRNLVALLLEHGAEPNAEGILRIALYSKDRELLPLLAKHGADLNAMDPALGWTPLTLALGDSSIPKGTAEALLELGASPNVAAGHGEGPLHLALSRFPAPSHPSRAVPAAPSPQPVPSAEGQVRSGSSDSASDVITLCKLLVEKKADVNARSASGESILHRAIRRPSVPLEFVSWLLARGADPAAKDSNGNTPAMAAPMDRRLWLEERVFFPALGKQRAIHSFIRLGNSFASAEPARREPVADFEVPPPADEMVRQAAQEMKDVKWVIPLELDLLVFRADAQGNIAKVSTTRIKTDARQAELPALQWGDVLVVTRENVNGGMYQDSLQKWRVTPPKGAPRKITVQLGERQREFELRGNATTWSPGIDPLPAWNLSELVSRSIAAEPRAQVSGIKVQRVSDGKTQEWEVNLRPDQPGADVKNLPAHFAPGDRLIIPLLPQNDPEALAARRTGIYRAAPDRIFGERVFQLTEDDDAPRTLGDLLAETYLRSPMVIPDPDLARIRIHRLKENGEETIEVNFAALVEQVDGATPREKARELDVPLQPGDIVEIVPRKDANLDEWKGFSGPERRFLVKALARDVFVQLISGEGKLQGLGPVFTEFQRFTDETGDSWKVVASEPAKRTRSPFRVMGLVQPDKNVLNVRLTSKGRTREFSAEQLAKVNPWLVEGDHLIVERF